MRRSVRSITTSLALGFALYFAARGIAWTVQPQGPLLIVAAIALYQRLGYSICPAFAPYVGMSLSVCMQKRLVLH